MYEENVFAVYMDTITHIPNIINNIRNKIGVIRVWFYRVKKTSCTIKIGVVISVWFNEYINKSRTESAKLRNGRYNEEHF